MGRIGASIAIMLPALIGLNAKKLEPSFHDDVSLSLSPPAVKCPTDSRYRPDQRLLENGDVDEASDEKFRLEEKQRTARRLRESRKERWRPV